MPHEEESSGTDPVLILPAADLVPREVRTVYGIAGSDGKTADAPCFFGEVTLWRLLVECDCRFVSAAEDTRNCLPSEGAGEQIGVAAALLSKPRSSAMAEPERDDVGRGHLCLKVVSLRGGLTGGSTPGEAGLSRLVGLPGAGLHGAAPSLSMPPFSTNNDSEDCWVLVDAGGLGGNDSPLILAEFGGRNVAQVSLEAIALKLARHVGRDVPVFVELGFFGCIVVSET